MAGSTEKYDIVVVGAGISGICAAYHIKNSLPNKSYVVFESRKQLGGTWDLFKYPGIRSDSDMFTLGYSFHPWPSPRGIADGSTILAYLHDTVKTFDLGGKIRYNTQVTKLSFDSPTATWTISVRDSNGASVTEKLYQASYVYLCTGYYDYEKGFEPVFSGSKDFRGPIIHPQHWPEDLDYKGKEIVLIGSGATAVTMLPAMSKAGAKHITMLQRSPTYMVAAPRDSSLAKAIAFLPRAAQGFINKWVRVFLGMFFYWLAKAYPQMVRRELINGAAKMLPKDFDVKTHFTPSYNPWDQRLCLVPDGDLFTSIRLGKASIVTDTIDRFTERGVLLKTGKELPADIIVTATGLNLSVMAGIEMTIDGAVQDLSSKVTYKGFMISDIPNLCFASGYVNASWTLKCDLTIQYMCRVIRHMDDNGKTVCVPIVPAGDFPVEPSFTLSSGYVLRSLDKLPKQGTEFPWKVYQNYLKDWLSFHFSPVDDGTLKFKQSAAISKL